MKKVKKPTISTILSYTAEFTEEPEGGFTVVVHALPGCVTYGKTFEEAKRMGKEAIELYLEDLADHGETAPAQQQSVLVPINVTAPKHLPLYA